MKFYNQLDIWEDTHYPPSVLVPGLLSGSPNEYSPPESYWKN